MPTSPADDTAAPVPGGPAEERPAGGVRYDVVVLGAGPAGLAAATAAARTGAATALVDAGSRVGGQFWRHRDGDDGAGHHHWSTLRTLVERLTDVTVLSRYAVWHVSRDPDGCAVHATVDGAERTVRGRTLVVATGAYDRQLPFPGWTLPGVYTAGGAQALLKGHGVAVGGRVVVAGTGPFLLPVATGLATAGATVAGVYEAGSPLGFARHPAALAGNPGKLAEGAGYLAALRRYRIGYRTRHTVVAAHGEDAVRAVTVARLDRDWHPVPGSERTVDCDAVAVGYGFTPQLEIPLQLGCATRLDVDGSLVATADDRQRASVPGVYLAGEVCGVGGSELALVEGELAGRHAGYVTVGARIDRTELARLLRRRGALRRFAAALHAAHPVPPGWTGWLTDDTVVCRCEEVDAGTVRGAVDELGATDARAIKLLARPGMGLCQGRVCGYATACLAAYRTGRAVTADDLYGLATRPVAQPITLGRLVDG